MDKYGYKKQEKDSRIKTAADRGKCPECGNTLSGQPPTCPVHGSEPFEERNAKEETDKGRG